MNAKMRIFYVLCVLLAIAVTSFARPDDTKEKPTTAVPLATVAKKDDSLSSTPASVTKSNDELKVAPASSNPTVTTVDQQKDPTGIPVAPTKIPTIETTNAALDTTSAASASEKVTPVTPPTTPAAKTTDVTKTTPTKTTPVVNVTTAVPFTTVCPPIPERHFDGLSFLGGIILTICLIGIGVFLTKYCQHIHEDKYRTL